MNKYHVIALSLLILGIIVLGYSAAIGESEVIWLVIIPIFIGHGIYSFVGVVIIILAILIGIYAFVQGGWALAGDEFYDDYYPPSPRPKPGTRPSTAKPGAHPPHHPPPPPRPKMHGGGVILIGPIPIIFGSDNKSAIILSILAIIIMIIAIIALFGGFFIPR